MNAVRKLQLENLVDVFNRGNFVILDTETTGLNQGEIVQIAIIDPAGSVLLDTLVKPVLGIPVDAQQIHGITPQMVKDAPAWQNIIFQIQEILTARDVITYNATYDRRMFHQSSEVAGLVKFDWKALSPWHCAMLAYAEFNGEWDSYHGNFRWQRLSVAARNCRVEVKDAHSALGDCLMTLGVIRYMAAAISSQK